MKRASYFVYKPNKTNEIILLSSGVGHANGVYVQRTPVRCVEPEARHFNDE